MGVEAGVIILSRNLRVSMISGSDCSDRMPALVYLQSNMVRVAASQHSCSRTLSEKDLDTEYLNAQLDMGHWKLHDEPI